MSRRSGSVARAFLLLGPVLGTALSGAQSPAVQAVLVQPLKADALKAGSTFTLRVGVPWEHDGCRLAPGVLLHARVRAVSRATAGHVHEMAFVIGAPCEDRKPLDLVVTGLLAPPKVETLIESFPGFGSFGGGANSAPAIDPSKFDGGAAMRGTPSAITTARVVVNKLPTNVTLGEVWRLPKIKLVLPAGEDVVSTVETTGSSLQLPIDTVVVLQLARTRGEVLRTVSVAPGTRVPQVPPSMHGFVKACTTGLCTAYGRQAASMAEALGVRQLGMDVNLKTLGFRAEHDREVQDLESGATVNFLGDHELLVTFPTHALVDRTGKERPTDNPRAVRGVLMDASTRTVERVLNWTVEDHNTYVWPLGDGLLVHDGRSLRLYGSALQVRATMALPMPLAALRVSPDGQRVLLGELRELHTPVEHESLIESDKRGPEEEIVWSVLDAHLQRITQLGVSSSLVPVPAVLNDGMVELRKGRDPEWFLVQAPWKGGEEKQLGSLRSSCLPKLGTVAPDLLTVETCEVSGDGMRTFVTRVDGAPVLEQASDAQEMPFSFAAAAGAPAAAMLLTRTTAEYERGLLFHLSVIEDQEVVVFDARNGNVIARVPLKAAAPYRQAFALSPDARTLALLAGDTVSLYALAQ